MKRRSNLKPKRKTDTILTSAGEIIIYVANPKLFNKIVHKQGSSLDLHHRSSSQSALFRSHRIYFVSLSHLVLLVKFAIKENSKYVNQSINRNIKGWNHDLNFQLQWNDNSTN